MLSYVVARLPMSGCASPVRVHPQVLALVSYLSISMVLPWMFWPVYSMNTGVLVASLPAASPLYGKLVVGDIVTGIDFHRVSSVRDWTEELTRRLAVKKHPCMLMQSLSTLIADVPAGSGCCVPGTAVSRSLCMDVCNVGHSPTYTCAHFKQSLSEGYCLSAPLIVNASTGSCEQDGSSPPDQCRLASLAHGSDVACVAPLDVPQMFMIQLRNGTRFAFAGSAHDVAALFVPSDYVPRAWVASILPTRGHSSDYDVAANEFPYALEPSTLWAWCKLCWSHIRMFFTWLVLTAPAQAAALCRFVVLVSLSMAAFNVLPIPHMDGHGAAALLVRAAILCRRKQHVDDENTEASRALMCSVDTTMKWLVRTVIMLVASNIALGFLSLLY